jgi:hypothetical protein
VGKKQKRADADWAVLVAELATVSRQLARLAEGPTSPPLWQLRRLEQRLASLTERIRVAAGLREEPLFYVDGGAVYDSTRKPPADRKKKSQ